VKVETKVAEFKKGILTNDAPIGKTSDRNGTKITFSPDGGIFSKTTFHT